MLSLLLIPLLVTTTASALESVGEERKMVQGRERMNRELGVEKERQFEGDTGEVEGKDITYKSAGDYTLVSVPWSKGATLSFNDTTASTLSTMGNAALLLGGLYLLSGFPAAAALADPFGFKRRLGVAAPKRPGPPPPRFQHRSNKEEKEAMMKAKEEKKKASAGRVRGRPSHRLREMPSSSPPVASDRQLNNRPRLPSLRPLAQFRPFNIPQLPALRMPQLPRLRRPTLPVFRPLPQLTNPFRRPVAPSRPRPAPRPAPQSVPNTTPLVPVFRPSPLPVSPPAPVLFIPGPQSERIPVLQSLQPLLPLQPLPVINPVPVQAPIPSFNSGSIPSFNSGSFASPFDGSDPFSEFQSSDFGPDEDSFRDLITSQFGSDFDSQRLPGGRRR